MPRPLHSLLLALLCLVLIGPVMAADESQEAASPPKEKTPPAKPKPEKSATKSAIKPAGKVKPVSAEREAELLKFVDDHHPELATLLKTLKTAQAKEYQAAVSDLDREVRHLDQIRKRSPAQVEAEVKMWIARSRIRLLSAQLSVSDDETLREELKSQLRELRQHELAALQLEIGSVQQTIEKQQQKLSRLQQRLSDLQTGDETWVMKQLATLEEKHRSTPKLKNIPKGKNKPKAKLKETTAP